MSEVLSQSEIDELLNALDTGEVDVEDIEEEQKEKKIRKYDFKRPDKFAKDQLRTLENLHESYSRLLNNYLSGYLRTITEVEVLSTQSLIFNEFSNSISNPAIIGIVDFAPLEGEIIFELSSDITFCMIERILGGRENRNGKDISRSLTEIETILLKNILKSFLELMEEAWENIIELNLTLNEIETNSQFAQIVSPTESIALITLNVKINNTEGMVNICLPHKVIEPILSNLSTKMWFSDISKIKSTKDDKEKIKHQLSKSQLPVRVIVGATDIRVNELLDITPGDVILLNKKVDDFFDVYVDKELKFKGQPGRIKNKVAIKVAELMGEGDEVDE